MRLFLQCCKGWQRNLKLVLHPFVHCCTWMGKERMLCWRAWHRHGRGEAPGKRKPRMPGPASSIAEHWCSQSKPAACNHRSSVQMTPAGQVSMSRWASNLRHAHDHSCRATAMVSACSPTASATFGDCCGYVDLLFSAPSERPAGQQLRRKQRDV